MILDQKEIFQGIAEEVTIGDTATHMYCQKVCTAGIPLIICCNDWAERLEEVSPAQRDWLDKNCLVVQVNEELWHNDRSLFRGSDDSLPEGFSVEEDDRAYIDSLCQFELSPEV